MTTNDEQSTASKAGGAAQEHGREVAGTARQQVGEVRQEATDHVRDLARQSGSQVRERADGHTKDLASTLGGFADELTSMADGSDQPDGAVAKLAHEAGGRLGSLSERLDSGGIDGALDDLRRFGRKRPGLFVGSCLVAGVVLGRALRNTDTAELSDAVRTGATDDAEAPEEPSTSGDGPSPSPAPSTTSPTPTGSPAPVVAGGTGAGPMLGSS